MSLTMSYCPSHKAFMEESNLTIALFEVLLITRWMDLGLFKNLEAPCAICTSGDEVIGEVAREAISLEAQAMQNGGEINTDRFSIKI